MGFTVGEHSAGHMRRILRIHLTRWELDRLADAAGLALTELVANVVRHVPGPLDEARRGLALVEAVTDRWGVDGTAAGKTVWFECDAEGAPGVA
ncbi:ATP-binding protein [Streptomyces sp. NPDC015130]|uniref:ATP-binding protein n=1 Tax=Streptomyces sp. NPDC015130 TaxID=3364940 RepID=UPI0037033030